MPTIRALVYHHVGREGAGIEIIEERVNLMKDALDDIGTSVWTLRVTMPPLEKPRERLGEIPKLAELSERLDVMIAALPLDSAKDAKNILEAISSAPRIYSSFLLRGDKDINDFVDFLLNNVNLEPIVFTRVAAITLRRITTPYFPAASSGDVAGLSASLRYVDLLEKEIIEGRDELMTYLKDLDLILSSIADRVGIKWMGFDLSPSPWMEESVASLIERISGTNFPGPGSAFAIALLNERVNEIIERSGIPTLGFNEVMLPVGEDELLMRRVEEGELTAWNLADLSAYCVAGVDMVPFSVEEEEVKKSLRGLTLDVLSASRLKLKPLGLRLIPVHEEPRKRVELGKFGRVPVVPLS